MDALDRMADRGIDEQENAIERVARHLERLCRDNDRLAEMVMHDAPGLRARNPQRVREVLGEIFAAAGERRCLQPLAHRRIARKADTIKWKRSDNVEVEQNEAPLVYIGREEHLVQLAGYRRINCGRDIRERFVRVRHVVFGIACRGVRLRRLRRPSLAPERAAAAAGARAGARRLRLHRGSNAEAPAAAARDGAQACRPQQRASQRRRHRADAAPARCSGVPLRSVCLNFCT